LELLANNIFHFSFGVPSMDENSVLILKFNRGSSVDKRLTTIQHVLELPDRAEAFRRAVSLAETIFLAQKEGAKLILKNPDGTETLLRIC